MGQGQGRPQHTCYDRRRGRGHLPGPITHAGKIESDYQTQDLDINIRAAAAGWEEASSQMRVRINIMSENMRW